MKSPPLQLESSPCSLQLDRAPCSNKDPAQLEIHEGKKKKKLAKPENSDCS